LPEPFPHGYGYITPGDLEPDTSGATPAASPAAATPLASPTAGATPVVVSADGFGAKPDADGLVDLSGINPSWAGSAGAAWSTLADLAIWVPALYGGATLSPAMHAERLKLVPFDPKQPKQGGYGLGIADFGGLYGHDGAIFGSSSLAVLDPSSGLTIIVIANLFPPKGQTASSEVIAEAIVNALSG
jgi:D-alanyl-D-alanine carboxypeptidase